MVQAHYPAHALIFPDGAPGDRLYLVAQGTVEIFTPTPDGDVTLNVIRAGDHFGEMSLLDNAPRSGGARALTDVTLVEISKPEFLALVRRFPALIGQISRVIDQRLRDRDAALVRQLETHNRQLRQLYETSLDISRHLERDAALAAIVQRAAALLESDRGELYLHDTAQQNLIAPAGDRLKPGHGPTGQAFSNAEPVIDNQGRHRVLAAPISLDLKPLGTLTVYRARRARGFTSEDARLLLLFANQAAIAIENARLYTLAVEKGRLDGELLAARQVQYRLIPKQAPRVRGLRLAGLWRPAREVSGDFYDFVPLPHGRWGVIIADVSDKGAGAALFMATARSILRATLISEVDPARTLERANRVLTVDAADNMFVTLFLAVLDPHARQLSFANAGHNPPLVWRGEKQRLEPLTPHGLALGIFEDAAFATRTIEFRTGDRFVLYTDGITDAVNSRGDRFGDIRLSRVIRANVNDGAHALARAVDQGVQSFIGAQPLADDTTVVTISVS